MKPELTIPQLLYSLKTCATFKGGEIVFDDKRMSKLITTYTMQCIHLGENLGKQRAQVWALRG
jgi:hypothetical protein